MAPIILTTPEPAASYAPTTIGYAYRDSSSGQGDIVYLDIGNNFGSVLFKATNVFPVNSSYDNNKYFTYDPVTAEIIHLRRSASTTMTYQSLRSSDYVQTNSFSFTYSSNVVGGATLDTTTRTKLYTYQLKSGTDNLLTIDYPPPNGGPPNITVIGGMPDDSGQEMAWDSSDNTIWYADTSRVRHISSVTPSPEIFSFAATNPRAILVKNGLIYTVDVSSPRTLREFTKTGTPLRTGPAGGLDAAISPGNPQGGCLFDWPHDYAPTPSP